MDCETPPTATPTWCDVQLESLLLFFWNANFILFISNTEEVCSRFFLTFFQHTLSGKERRDAAHKLRLDCQAWTLDRTFGKNCRIGATCWYHFVEVVQDYKIDHCP
jgi:hypothetical protein